MTITIDKILGVFFFFLCLFPYISLIDTPFDTQPYAIAFSFVLLFLLFTLKKDLKLPVILLPFIFVFAYSLFIFLVRSSDWSNGLRSLIGYASVCFIAIGSYHTFNQVKGKHFATAVMIWFIFGVIQLLVNKDFGSFLLSRLSTSDDRGVTSLAVEPSFYSIICIFFFVLNDVFYARGDYSKSIYRILFLLITAQIFFARAGVGIVLFFIYLGAKVISKRKFVNIVTGLIGVLVVFGIVVCLYLYSPSLQLTRVGMLLNYLIHDPIKLIQSDGSIADRLVHIFISHLSLFYSYGIGYGLGNWNEYALEIAFRAGGIVLQLANVNITLSGRIMSGWGTAIFELGIVGILFLASFLFLMRKGWKKTKNQMKSVYLSSAITIFFTMLMAVPLAFPLFGYVIGIFAKIQNKDI